MAGISDLFGRMPTGDEAREWGRRHSDDLGEAWLECPRGDWLLWLAGILEVGVRPVTLAALDCANFALSLLAADEDEERLAAVLVLANRWLEGEVEPERLRCAAQEVLAIYHDPSRDGSGDHPLAGYATSAVAAAVLVPTYRSTYGLACSALAAGQAAAQVAAPNDETALLDAHAYCARLVRKRIPFPVVVAAPGFASYARSVVR